MLKSIRSYFSSSSDHAKLVRLIVLTVILVVIPLIVIIAQRQTELRQRAGGPSSPPYPPGEAVLTLSPLTTSVNLNEPLSLDVIIKAGTNDITGVDISINSNPSILAINKFVPGTQFNSQLISRIESNGTVYRYAATNTDVNVHNTGDVRLGTLVLDPKALGLADVKFIANQVTALNVAGSLAITIENGTYTVTVTQPTATPSVGPTVIVTLPPTLTPIPTQTPTQGDADGNGEIDILDYNIWRDEFLSANPAALGGGGYRADFNRDGRVDLVDFNIWRTAFAGTTPSPTTQQPTPTTISTAKRVFVTSTTYNGNLGGLSGADAKCQERGSFASVGSLGGGGGIIWKAWLSDDNTLVASRLTHNNGPYKLVNGTIVANNWADLTDGTLQAPINITELNQTKSSFGIWTNTDIDGTRGGRSSSSCGNWLSSSSSILGWLGTTPRTDSFWTINSSDVCSSSYPIYCFEQ